MKSTPPSPPSGCGRHSQHPCLHEDELQSHAVISECRLHCISFVPFQFLLKRVLTNSWWWFGREGQFYRCEKLRAAQCQKYKRHISIVCTPQGVAYRAWVLSQENAIASSEQLDAPPFGTHLCSFWRHSRLHDWLEPNAGCCVWALLPSNWKWYLESQNEQLRIEGSKWAENKKNYSYPIL